MIAIILAAGMSKRLQPLTNDKPKCLLPVGETTLLTRFLNLLEQAGVVKTIIVHGFCHKAIESEVALYQRSMAVDFIHCEDYKNTHPIHSFLLTEEAVNDDFLLLNSDIYFSLPILDSIINNPESCIAVDSAAPFIENEMFVNYDSDMAVTAISKSLAQRAYRQAKSVQIAKFLLSDKLEIYSRAKEVAGTENIFYPAQAFDTLIEKKKFSAVDIAGAFTHEIDTLEDYETLLSKIIHN